MSLIASEFSGGHSAGVPLTSGSARNADFDITVHQSLEAAEGPWRELEARGVVTPYQRFDWVNGLLRSGSIDPQSLAIGVLGTTQPLAILPLCVERRYGLRTAHLIGSSLSNSDWLPISPEAPAQLTPELLTKAFASVGHVRGGIDLVFLSNQTQSWGGLSNPALAFAHEAAPSHFYRAALDRSQGSVVDTRLNYKRRSNLRRGARRLAEQFGSLEFRRATTREEIVHVQDAFLAQRAERFASQGIDNIFARPDLVRLFRTLAQEGVGQTRPSIAFHALHAGGEILATSIGTYADDHYSQYINSTSSGPAAKYSLMGILMAELVEVLAADGITSLDMGIGDFDYKNDWTDTETVYDSAIPMTARGRAAVPIIAAARRLKRKIKQTPRLWHSAQALRLAVYRLRSGR